MTRCLVIGGNGFIGSYVVDELVAAGHEVTVFDRFSGLRRFRADPVREVAGDFLNVGDVEDIVAGQDVIFHLLSMTNPASAEADPLLDIRTNVTASIELFRVAAEASVGHLYFVSTGGAIYGEQPTNVVDEDATPLPVSPYAIGKLTIERYLDYFRRVHGLQSTILRLSNPYGPRQSPTRRQGVIPIFLRNLASGRPITVFGDGSMERDYIYVEDAAKMLVAPMAGGGRHAVYNVGSGRSHSLNEIIASIRRVTGIEPVIERKPTPPTFVQHIALSTDRYRSDFGEPTRLVDLDEGVRRTWTTMTEKA
ncbi:NAD-dependent epimerase/dehydratase family protein [Microbacterium betulae]|uniref:NAD-dependent epimerase/dehydratase family protein n=1 Tax=Microbacterium betulae TaxID=2981139 RepID=A0AA97FFS1_9MICO|nr:NAD-dependent epimerase/dehydratase family protein [Microbacterium sp. AB]WOF22358.1 NAD-dependent epimerase/dehydratase family protein [Microbacterium sp. AB]